MQHDAPNLIHTRPNRTNTVRNLLFIFLIFGLVGWYGVRFAKEVEHVAPLVSADSASNEEVGGDVVIQFREQTFIEPVQVTTNTLDVGSFSAEGFLVKDITTGKSLVTHNEYAARPIASITKLMSAIVLLDTGIPLTGTTTAANGEVFDTFLLSNFVYDTEDVWNTALVGSSNRAILSLVDRTGMTRDAFVAQMNAKARELGMSDTVFTDPSGLDEGNTASASDVLILLKEALDRGQIYDALRQKEYSIATIAGAHERDMYNTNWLLLGWIPHRFSLLHPGKTGYIPASGYNFTTRIENEEGHSIDIVVLGADSHESRFEETRDIANWVFTNFDWQKKTIRTRI